MTLLQKAMIDALKVAGQKWNPKFDAAKFERDCVASLAAAAAKVAG